MNPGTGALLYTVARPPLSLTAVVPRAKAERSGCAPRNRCADRRWLGRSVMRRHRVSPGLAWGYGQRPALGRHRRHDQRLCLPGPAASQSGACASPWWRSPCPVLSASTCGLPFRGGSPGAFSSGRTAPRFSGFSPLSRSHFGIMRGRVRHTFTVKRLQRIGQWAHACCPMSG